MRRCDVLIVGGGPAGSSCARRLVASGLDVVVIDQARFPRDKTCAGWITPPVLERLGIDRTDYAQGRVLQPITGFRVACGTGHEVRVNLGSVVSYGIRRCEFDAYLLERSGAAVHDGTRVNEIERTGSQWVVNGCFTAPMLVGAGGHFCPVAKTLGARVSQEAALLAQEAEWSGESRADPVEPLLVFFPDRRGYAWCFQKQGFVNLGFGRLGGEALMPYRRQTMEMMRARGTLDTEPSGWHGHAYLTADASRRRVLEDGVLLAGDSAGLADPRSGEGILPAVESGLIAAETILLAGGDYGRSRLAPYASRLGSRFPSQTTSWPVPESIAQGLMSLPLFVREVVVKRWFLHLRPQFDRLVKLQPENMFP